MARLARSLESCLFSRNRSSDPSIRNGMPEPHTQRDRNPITATKRDDDRANAPRDRPMVGALPSASQVDRMISGTVGPAATVASDESARARGIAVAPSVDLGDHEMGRRSVHDVPLFNLDPGLVAQLRVEVVGHRALRLVEAPTHLRPSWSVAGAAHPIRIAFSPEKEPSYAAKLVIHAAWEMNRRPPEVVEVPITAVAHAPGQPTVAEQHASESAARARADEEHASAEARARTEEQIARYHEQPVLRHHEGNRKKLEDKRSLLQSKMVDLSNGRHIGVTEADKNIGEFRRKKPTAENPSLLETLAWAALDVATGGLAKGISTAMKGPIRALLTRSAVADDGAASVDAPSEAIVDFLTEGVKSSVKKVGSNAVKALRVDGRSYPAHTSGAHSLDVKAAFIREQTQAFWENAHSNAFDTALNVYNSLLVSVLDANPKAAFAAMDLAIRTVEEASVSAVQQQRDETIRHWVRYLAQTSLGSVPSERGLDHDSQTEPDLSLTDMRPATQAPDLRQPLRTFDGLVDVQFSVNVSDPTEPARPQLLRLHGVRRKVAEVLASQPLLDAKVAVRASAVPSESLPRSANVPLTVTRDESGGIAHVDNLRLEWEEPSWLSRKAGSLRGSPSAQQAGARKLIEDELMRRPLIGVRIETDGES
jgi:hypothetical protein